MVNDTLWELTGPRNTRTPGPIAARLDEAARMYLDKTSTEPNVALIAGGDWEEASALDNPFTVDLHNGRRARIELQRSPFGGMGRDLHMGRKEVLAP